MEKLILIAAIIVLVVLRRISAAAGALLGMSVAATAGIWGYRFYGQGYGIELLGMKLPKNAFLAIVLLWFAIELVAFVQAMQRRRRAQSDTEE